MAMNNNNGNKRKNWLTMKREQFGNNWIDKVQSNDIQNNCLRMIQDISRANFDTNGQDMIDFCDPRIMNAVIEYVDHKTASLTEVVNAMALLQSSPQCSGNTAIVFGNLDPSLKIYKNIKDSLEGFRMNGDISLFINMTQNIRNFRNYIDLNRSI